MVKIAPSLLSADYCNMEKGIREIENESDYLHCDIMDGVFVPNISFGIQMVKRIHEVSQVPLDVHLMIVEPEKYIERFAEAGADIITVHVEATRHLQRTLTQIRECGIQAGAVLNPATPLDCLTYILDDLDMILLMSVNPGYGGQKFIPAVLQKVKDLKKMLDGAGKDIPIEVDGGVNLDNAEEIVNAGAEVLVAGSAVFGAKNPNEAIKRLRGEQ